MRPIPTRPPPTRAAALSAIALALSSPIVLPAQEWTKYVAPPTVEARDSLLSTSLTPRPGTVTLAGKSHTSNMYDGLLLPPLLRLKPGDSLRVRLVNRMAPGDANVTNLHFHGFAVSPRPPADNVTMTHVAPGDSFQYAMRLPADHAEGLFWYHAHAHGTSYEQLRGGLSGAISIGDPRRHFSGPVRTAPEFFLLLKQYEPDGNTSISTVNGVERVRLPDMRAGDVQFWRIANISTERYYRMQLRGPDGRVVAFRTLARDGNVVRDGPPVMDTTILLGAGQRAEIAVSGAEPGEYTLAATDFTRQTPDALTPLIVDSAALLARVRVLPAAPGAAVRAGPLAGNGGHPAEARAIRLLASRGPGDVERDTVEFEIIRAQGQPTRYLIDSLAYDPDRVDKSLRVGRTYEWTITNPTLSWHPFHIHQTDFLVLRAGPEQMPPDYRLDTVNVPPGGDVVIRFTYERPSTAGPFVYHCHVLFHEDSGMMANVVLHAPATADAPATTPTQAHGHAGSRP